MPSSPSRDVLKAIEHREEILDILVDGVDDRQELVSQVSVSRMTVDRALRELEELSIAASEGSDYWLTPFGHLAYKCYKGIISDYESIEEVQDLLELLPENIEVDTAIFNDSVITRASMTAPELPKKQLLPLIQTRSNLRLLTPVVSQDLLRAMHDRALEDELPSALIVDEKLAEHLWVEQGFLWKPYASSAHSTVLQSSKKPPFGLLVTEEEMVLGFFDDLGSLKGTIKNKSTSAISWAEAQLDSFIQQSQELIPRSSSFSMNSWPKNVSLS